LVELWTSVPPGERDAFLSRARARQAALGEIGVSYWVFEHTDRPGEMVQYVEARDPMALARARALLEVRADERDVTLHQLEL
jgi:uncharacterized protein with GYD domain